MPCEWRDASRPNRAPPRPPVVQSNAGQHAKALSLDEDLALRAFLRADLAAEIIVGAQKPLAIPTVPANSFFHARGFRQVLLRFLVPAPPPGDGRQFLGRQHEQRGDEDRLGHLAFLVGGRLKRLARRVREAVQIQAVVPIGAADQGKPVRPQPVQRVTEAAPQVLVERLLRAGLVVVLHRLVQNAPVAGLFQIRGDANDQPVRIVVEIASHIVVALLGQRLVLVIGAAAGKLRRGKVQDALAGARRNHLHEAEQVLVGIAEAQAAPDARFVKRRRARHVERGHALVGVPHVHHAVGVDVGRMHLADAQQAVPVGPELFERRIHVGRVEVPRDHRLYGLLIDRLRIRRIELLGPRGSRGTPGRREPAASRPAAEPCAPGARRWATSRAPPN